jgi:hypothetical protein
MSRVCVITAIYDDYDSLKPVMHQDGMDVEWVLVTDTMPDPDAARGWSIVIEPRPGVHPNRAAKRAKFIPWDYTDAYLSIWVDASFRVVASDFVRSVTKFANPIAQFVHPWRNCLFAEAEVSAKLPKYGGERVLEQADAYRDWGHPEHWGLWATGVIARQHTQKVRDFGYTWLHEIEKRSFQDQISQPYALRTMGLRPTGLPGNHLANHWLQYEGSARH